MPGRLRKIVEYVEKNSVFKDLALARMTMLVKEDVNKITDASPDDAAKEKTFLDAAKEILGVASIPL